jgi:hypothetical protein
VTGGSLALFLNLYLGHLLGDFLFQPGKLVLAKRRGAPGLLVHTLIIGITCTAVLFGQLAELWPAVLLIVAAHAAIELITIFAYEETPTRSLFTFLLDQALHLLSIGLVVWIVDEWRVAEGATTFGVSVEIGSLAVLVGVLVAGLLGSILVFETANTLMSGRDGKGTILTFDWARVGGILERMAAVGAALTIGPLTLPIPFLPRSLVAWRAKGRVRRRQLIILGTGLLLCSVVYGLLLAADASFSVSVAP